MRWSGLGALVTIAVAIPAWAAPPGTLSPAEQKAVFAAAGFEAKHGAFVRCIEEPRTPSYVPGHIEVADLNRDGLPEAWVLESSTSCYGDTAEAFVLLSRDARGNWRKILAGIGIAEVQKTRHAGWPDIAIGGPGVGPTPRYRYNGTKYVALKS